MTYIERQTEIAEKMAASKYELFPQIREGCIAEMMPLAAIALKEMANSFICGYGAKILDEEGANTDYLKELGLIP